MKKLLILAILLPTIPPVNAGPYGCVGALGAERGDQIQICNIDFLNLVANPEKYDGRYFIVRGYVAIDTPRIRLFASRPSYIYGGAHGGIDLLVGDNLSDLQELADGERPITVRGQFFANPKRELNGVPGRIELSSGGAWMTTPPGQTPEPPRPARGA